MEIIIGIFCLIVGGLMVWKPRWFLGMLGDQNWAEKVFGVGHETTAYQTIGVILIIIGFLSMTGFLREIVVGFFTPIMPQ